MTKQKTSKKQTSVKGRPSAVKSRVSAPVATSTVCTAGRPVLQPMTGNRTRVTHREMVGTFTVPSGTSGFYRDPVSIMIPGYDGNPASSILFPWLSSVASNYERYHFRSLKIDLVSSQPTTAGGRVYMAWDYDYDDAPATTKQQFMSNRLAKEGGVWMTLSLQVDCAEAHRDMQWKYCSLAQRSVTEPRTAFIGYLLLGADTGGAVDTDYTWDLWVSYDCELDLPCLETENLGETYSNSVTIGVDAITDTIAGAKGGRALTFSPLRNCRMKVVQPGSGTNPLVNLDTVSDLIGLGVPQQMLDLADCNLDDAIELYHELMLTGASPATLMNTQSPWITCRMFDWAGSYLGNLGDSLAYPKFIPGMGPAVPSQVTTTSAFIKTLVNTDWGSIKSVFNTARYLVPVLMTATALGAGQQRSYLKTM